MIPRNTQPVTPKGQPVGVYAVALAGLAWLWSILAWVSVTVPVEVTSSTTTLVVAVGGVWLWGRVSPTKDE